MALVREDAKVCTDSVMHLNGSDRVYYCHGHFPYYERRFCVKALEYGFRDGLSRIDFRVLRVCLVLFEADMVNLYHVFRIA